MCTDDAGWYQFCLFTPAGAMKNLLEGNFQDGDVSSALARALELNVTPYLKFLNSKFKSTLKSNVFNNEIDILSKNMSVIGIADRKLSRLNDSVKVTVKKKLKN